MLTSPCIISGVTSSVKCEKLMIKLFQPFRSLDNGSVERTLKQLVPFFKLMSFIDLYERILVSCHFFINHNTRNEEKINFIDNPLLMFDSNRK